MVAGNLDTTNLLLGIMAAVSVLEALLLVAVGFMAYRLYRQALQMVKEIEERRIAPLAAQLGGLIVKADRILADVKDVTWRVTQQTERVDSAIRHTMDRVDETAGRVRESVAQRVNRLLGLARWARSIIDALVHSRRASHEAPGRA